MLKVNEYERNGQFLESYSAKLIYHAGYYSIIYGLLTKLIFKRVSLGFAFGFGYGAGQIHQDFIRAVNKGLQTPPHIEVSNKLYSAFNYFFKRSTPVNTETRVAEVQPTTSPNNTQETTTTSTTTTHNSESVNNEVQNPIVNSEQAPKNL